MKSTYPHDLSKLAFNCSKQAVVKQEFEVAQRIGVGLNGVRAAITALDVFEAPMLVVTALVCPGTQLSAVVHVPAFDVEHFADVISVHDLVAVDAPELLAITQLQFAHAHAVTWDTTAHQVEFLVSGTIVILFLATLSENLN